jgi:chromosome transmission fidelity protein 4
VLSRRITLAFLPLLLQWDLVCERKQLANVAQTVLMFGMLVGNVLFGMLADR